MVPRLNQRLHLYLKCTRYRRMDSWRATGKFKTKEKIQPRSQGKNIEFHFAELSKTKSATLKYCSIAFI